jgi:putative N6-adenine-specific DNA methylase
MMPVQQNRLPILASCAKGVPPYLAAEIRSLGYPVLAERQSGVETEGTFADAMRMNLHLRTAQRVMVEVSLFRARNADDLYAQVRNLPWETWLAADGYVRVASAVSTSSIRDPRFASLRAKDAIVDRIRVVCGRRPDSGPDRDRASVFVYWNDMECRVYLDTSGESLSRRGYRKAGGEAPMQESLAAALIMATGWDGTAPLVNPMCGSGTLAIEAALLALNRAPGMLRDNFAFMHIKGFDRGAWERLRQAVRGTVRTSLRCGKIVATDHDPRAVENARRNAKAAGVDSHIEFQVCDFAETRIPSGAGIVILNPEYGVRLGEQSALEVTYKRIGDFFKQRCQGYTGYMFTGNMELAKKQGLRTFRKLPFFNGEIECRLLGYQLYAGSVRAKYARKAQNLAATDTDATTGAASP